jgi:hypothetical protein
MKKDCVEIERGRDDIYMASTRTGPFLERYVDRGSCEGPSKSRPIEYTRAWTHSVDLLATPQGPRLSDGPLRRHSISRASEIAVSGATESETLGK